MLYYSVLHCTVLYCNTVLCYAALYRAALYCSILCSVIYVNLPYSAEFNFSPLPPNRYETDPTQSLDLRGSVLLKGLALTNRAVHLAKTFLVLHSENQIPIGELFWFLNLFYMRVCLKSFI